MKDKNIMSYIITTLIATGIIYGITYITIIGISIIGDLQKLTKISGERTWKKLN